MGGRGILLQKTTVAAVSGAYVPFITQYPTAGAVVAACSDEIEDRISPLGLSKRAAYIERCAGQLLTRHSDKVPASRSDQLVLHRVGEYTARSVLIHSGGRTIAAVDTNVECLLSRFFGCDPVEGDIGERADAIVLRNAAATSYTLCSTSRQRCVLRVLRDATNV